MRLFLDASRLVQTAVPGEGWGGQRDAREVRVGVSSTGDVCLKVRRPGDPETGCERDVWMTAAAARELAALLLYGADVAEDRLAWDVAYSPFAARRRPIARRVLARAAKYTAAARVRRLGGKGGAK